MPPGRRSAAARVPPAPTPSQIAKTSTVVEWYLRLYHGRRHNLGTLDTFTDRRIVGHFAVSAEAIRRETSSALFKLLIAVTLFQRRQDQQVLRILRGMSREDVSDLTDIKRLLRRCDATRCVCLRSTAALHDQCDLTKNPVTKRGMCHRNPRVACHLKRHTVLLKRYGHFGKVPSSAALSLREMGAASVGALKRDIWNSESDPRQRALALEAALMRTWRVSRKIAAMYLSILTVPSISAEEPVWGGVDWSRYVVIDSNTDRFLSALRYRGPWTYDGRWAFIQSMAKCTDAGAGRERGGPAPNPRIIQQAMYAFMSVSNRRATPEDCSHALGACEKCPSTLARLCPMWKRRRKVL